VSFACNAGRVLALLGRNGAGKTTCMSTIIGFLPPRDGDIWRMDFSRFNKYREAKPAEDSGGWAWSAHGVWDSHVPEVFPFIHFSTKVVGNER